MSVVVSLPGRVVACSDPDHLIAQVDLAGARRAVNIAPLGSAITVGDWVIVAAGSALSRVDETEALARLAGLSR
jgi:hydrogenase expression/formation protein HypC